MSLSVVFHWFVFGPKARSGPYVNELAADRRGGGLGHRQPGQGRGSAVRLKAMTARTSQAAFAVTLPPGEVG